MSLTNVQLDRHCRARVPSYQGCFSKDRLPARRRIGFYIINLQDNLAGEGTHWVLLQVKAHSSWYFDSYGAPPPMAVRSFTTGPLYYSNGIVQGLNSDNCGRFCADVMQSLNSGLTLERIIRGFTASADANDRAVVRQWNRL